MRRPATAARRYAEAAFEIAVRDGTIAAWREQLALAAAVVADERVARIVDSPAIPLARREALLGEALGADLSTPALNLVRLLVRRGRAALLPQLAREFQRLANRREGIVEATVRSAVPLGDDDMAALRARLEATTGGRVELSASVDPDLVGGLVVRVGDRLIDSSVRGRLERLRDQLVAGAR